jgi:uncharacterized protein (TIGR03083 family)
VVRQRRRLVAALGSFSAEEWAHPSRCEGWSNRDVVVHLDATNAFWSFSIDGGLAGQPTTFLATFDPVATPAELVAAAGDPDPAEVLERFATSTEALVARFLALDEDGWAALAESPPGHVSIGALAHHALWDSWVHERDILLPLGHQAVEEEDEIVACLAYAAALGPTFLSSRGHDRRGALAVRTTDPAVEVVVEVDETVVVRLGGGDADLCLGGPSVELVDALSIRGPLTQPVPQDAAWLLSGLAEAFDEPSPVA